MNVRSMAVQGGLALVGLAAAYATWQRPREVRKAETAVVLTATKQSLENVHFDDGTRFVELARVQSPEPRLWVTTGFLEGKRPVIDAGITDAGADVPLPTASFPELPLSRTAPAAERADALIARFIPLEAARALGVLPTAKLQELGLADSTRHLEVTVAGEKHRYLVSKAISGVIGSYLQDERSQQVYLVQSTLFSELDPTAQLLVDRRLHTFKQTEVDRFTLTTEGKTVDYVIDHSGPLGGAKVARASQPTKPDEMAKNWSDKVFNRLIVTDILGKGELPRTGEPKVAVRLEYFAQGQRKGWLEFGVDPARGVWARSENTASWVGLHQGSDDTVSEAKRLVE